MKTQTLKTYALVIAVSLIPAGSLLADNSNDNSSNGKNANNIENQDAVTGASTDTGDYQNGSITQDYGAQSNANAPESAPGETRDAQNNSQKQQGWWQPWVRSGASQDQTAYDNDVARNKWDWEFIWKDNNWSRNHRESNSDAKGNWNDNDWRKNTWHDSWNYDKDDTGWQSLW